MASVMGGLSVHPATLADIHSQLSSSGVDTVSGLSFGLGFDTIAGSTGSSGLDIGPGPLSFAGQGGVTTETVVATQTVQPGGVALHFADGSSINVLGATHIDKSFFQG